MMKRIGLWAFAGCGVAVYWAFFAATASFLGYHFDYSHWILVRLTFPLSWFPPMRMSYYETIFLNAATYALIGLMAEPLWRRRHFKAS